MAILRIAKVGSEVFTALPTPSKMTLIVQDIDSANTTRSANGTMLRDRVSGGAGAKRKLELEWAGMDAARVSTILQSIGDEFFRLEYPDAYTGATRIAEFYTGDRSADMYSYNLYGNGILWKSLKANFIEK
jgi:hypothetical protein